MTTIPIIISYNIDDYRYLLHTTHTDDDDHRLYKIINIDIIDSDTDGDIIVGYRQHILPNNKLDHSDILNIVNVLQHKIGSSKLIFKIGSSKKMFIWSIN